MAAPTAPTGVAWRRITGWLMELGGDPVIGSTFAFTPTPVRVYDTTSTPAVWLAGIARTGRIGVDHKLYGPDGLEGVWIVDPNDGTLSPTGFNYQVVATIPGQDVQTFSIDIPVGAAGSDVDLTSVSPVDPRLGTPNVKGPPGDPSTVPGPPGDGVPSTGGASAGDVIAYTGSTTAWQQPSVTAAQISDATTTGRNVLKAASQAAARSAIGAGTGNGSSNLVTGTTPGTAADGSTVATNTGGAREKSAALSATSGTCTGNLNNASIFTVSPTGNITLSLTNIPASPLSCTTQVRVAQGVTPRTVTLMSGTKHWFTDEPVQTANKTTTYTFQTIDGGTNWDCFAGVEK